MHGCVAIGAARDEGLRIMGRADLRDGMAVDAGPGLIRREQMVGAGAVGDVAMAAIFCDRSVFVDERSRLGLMTCGALRGLRAQSDLATLSVTGSLLLERFCLIRKPRARNAGIAIPGAMAPKS